MRSATVPLVKISASCSTRCRAKSLFKAERGLGAVEENTISLLTCASFRNPGSAITPCVESIVINPYQ
eukprot:4253611-Amphidinium_carterae.7